MDRRGQAGRQDSVVSAAAIVLALQDHAAHLRPGELGSVLCVANTAKQAGIVFGFIRGNLLGDPVLASLIRRETADTIELVNNVEITVAPPNFRSIRGRTVIAAILDEVAFYADEEAAASDVELYAAILPAMATIPGAMLFGLSSPHGRSGLLYQKFTESFGKDDPDVLVIRGPSKLLNPTLDQRLIDDALERDPERAASEYLAEFRDDVGAFLDRELVERCTDAGVTQRAPLPGVDYAMAADFSDGKSDSTAAAIAHLEDGVVVLDALFERRPPFPPSEVFRELAAFARPFRIARVVIDKFAAGLVGDGLRAVGLSSEVREASTSDTYLHVVPAFAEGAVRLIEDRRLHHQLTQLQRHVRASGGAFVTHPARSHDDLAAAVASVIDHLRSAATPALVRREALLADDRLVEMPRWCRSLVAVLALNPARSMAALAFFAERAAYAMGPRGRASGTAADPAQATLIDVLEVPLVDIADRLRRRLEELADIVRPLDGFGCIVPEECVSSFHMDNVACEAWPVEWLTEPSSLTMPLSGYVARGEFRIARPALERGLPLGGALALRAGEKIGDDALQLAILLGLRWTLMWTAAEDFPIDAAAITGW